MSNETRRSSRLPLKIPVEISYIDAQSQPSLERTHTLVVDRHGARIASRSFHPVGSMIHLGVPHLGRSAHCRVIWCSAPANGIYEVGVEMDADANVWGIHFPDPQPENDLAVQGASTSLAVAILVQLLQEKGVLRRGEFEARLSAGSYAERPTQKPEIVLI